MPNYKILHEVCQQYNIEHEVLDDNKTIIVSRGSAQFISRSQPFGVFPNERRFSARLARSKSAAKQILARAELPVIPGFTLEHVELTDKCFQEKRLGHTLDFPLVIKPESGQRGKDVFFITNHTQFSQALTQMQSREQTTVLVEQLIDAPEYRLVCRKGVPIFSYQKKPRVVTGDGQHSVAELLTATHLPQNVIENTLRKHELHLSDKSILNKIYELALPTNLTHGGTYINFCSEFSEEVQDFSRRVYYATGIEICGIDLFSNGSSLDSDGVRAIIELNCDPSLSPAYTEKGLDFVYQQVWLPTMDEYFHSLSETM